MAMSSLAATQPQLWLKLNAKSSKSDKSFGSHEHCKLPDSRIRRPSSRRCASLFLGHHGVPSLQKVCKSAGAKMGCLSYLHGSLAGDVRSLRLMPAPAVAQQQGLPGTAHAILAGMPSETAAATERDDASLSVMEDSSPSGPPYTMWSVEQLPVTTFEREYSISRRLQTSGKLVVRVMGLEDGKRGIKVVLTTDVFPKAIFHWGVASNADPSWAWEQPPASMHPPCTTIGPDAAVQTLMEQVILSPSEDGAPGKAGSRLEIIIDEENTPAAINFVIRDEETGIWHNDHGRNFVIPLPAPPAKLKPAEEQVTTAEPDSDPSAFAGLISAFTNIFHPEAEAGTVNDEEVDDSVVTVAVSEHEKPVIVEEDDDESLWNGTGQIWSEKEYTLYRDVTLQNTVRVGVEVSVLSGVRVRVRSDMEGPLLFHWGVVAADADTLGFPKNTWLTPPSEVWPANSQEYKKRAIQTTLQMDPSTRSCGVDVDFGSPGVYSAVRFVLKDIPSGMWFDDHGSDYAAPLPSIDELPIGYACDEEGLLPCIAEGLGTASTSSLTVVWPDGEMSTLAPTTPASSPVLAPEEFSQPPQEVEISVNPSIPEAEEEGVASAMQLSPLEILDEEEKLEEGPHMFLDDPLTVPVTPVLPPPEGADVLVASHVGAVVEEDVVVELPLEEEVKVGRASRWRPAEGASSGTGTGSEILLQGFNWESHRSRQWYNTIAEQAKEIASLGFSVIWLPPPTESISPEGYMPKDLFNLDSRYGTMEALQDCIDELHDAGVHVLGDVVLNHRCAHYQNHHGVWNIFGGRLSWDERAIVNDDPNFHGRGNRSSGDNFHAAPNIDHSQDFVRRGYSEWLEWLRNEVGYDGWRLDYVRGFWGGYVKEYMVGSAPYFAVGEYWDSLSYSYGKMDYNQDAHRQRIIDWINATGGNCGAFDVTTKGILHTALERCEYWRLTDASGKPPGVLGWWPSRAVTFIENHDTGSTQGHWRFPQGKEMQGYAYILTHPGTPTVFYDHMFSHMKDPIAILLDLRKRAGLHCRSSVYIEKAEAQLYVARIDDKVLVKIGPGHYEPPQHGSQRWNFVTEGHQYKVWEAASA